MYVGKHRSIVGITTKTKFGAALVLGLVAIGSSASAATVDDFESLAIGDVPSGWTVTLGRVNLGSTSLGGCTSIDTSNYQTLRDYYAEADPLGPPTMGTEGIDHPNIPDLKAFIAPGASTQYLLGSYPLWWNSAYGDMYAGPSTATVTGSDPTTELVFWDNLFVGGEPTADQKTFLDSQKDWLNDSFGDLSQDSSPEFSVGVVDGSTLNSDYGDVSDRPGQVFQFYSDMSLDDEGYVIHGPAVVTQDLIVNTGATFSFYFAASGDSDDFHAFGYLLNTETCEQLEIIDRTGESNDWELITVPVTLPGTYKFVFVSGTYDQSWGGAAGGLLWIDGMECEGDCVVTSGDSGAEWPVPWYLRDAADTSLPNTR